MTQFWKTVPRVSWWDTVRTAWSGPKPPQILDTKENPQWPTPPNFLLEEVNIGRVDLYNKFLLDYYNESSSKIQLDLPTRVISAGLVNDYWIGVEAYNKEGQLIGIVFSLPFANFFAPPPPLMSLIGDADVRSHPNQFSGFALVDYFCVRPDWRSRGVGSALLQGLFFLTSRVGRKAHIFASEGNSLFSKIPPFIRGGKYYWRLTDPSKSFFPLTVGTVPTQEVINDISKRNWVGITEANTLKMYSIQSGNTVLNLMIKPTYEIIDASARACPVLETLQAEPLCSSVRDKPVLEVVGWSIIGSKSPPTDVFYEAALDSISSESVAIFVPNSFPRTTSKPWIRGASFAWYAFHFHPGQFNSADTVGICIG